MARAEAREVDAREKWEVARKTIWKKVYDFHTLYGIIYKDNYSAFNGKRAGMNRGSVQAGFFREWAEAHGVQAQLLEMTEDVVRRADKIMYENKRTQKENRK